MRTFIALELSDEIRKKLGALIQDLRTAVQFTPARPKWVRPESIHLTLKFLGQIEETMVEPIGEVMKKAALETPPFNIKVRNLGVFPHERKPRVLWTGLSSGGEQTERLQQKLESGLIPLGFEAEKRPFHPHLTLARIKALRGTGPMMKVLANHKRRFVGENYIDKLALYKSELHPSGAVYTPLVEVPLTGEAK